MMLRFNQEEGRYRVLLIGIGDSTEEEKESFCYNLSKNYSISFPLLKKIVDRCPIILKKNLSLKKAAMLTKTLQSFGAMISVEEKREFPSISLEFQDLVPHLLALESSSLRKTRRGIWSVLGRAVNISDENLEDIWVLIQLFDALGEFIFFEEAPLSINPLPSGEASPFKVVFEGGLSIKKISVAFKNASGQPIPTIDKRKKREWVEVEIEDEGERIFPSPQVPIELENRSEPIGQTEPSTKRGMGKEVEMTEEIPLSLEQETEPTPGEEINVEQREDIEKISEQSYFLPSESSEEAFEASADILKEDGHQAGEELEGVFGNEAFQKLTSSIPEALEEEREGATFVELELPSDDEDVVGEPRLEASVFEEATQLLEDISEGPGKVEAKEKSEEGEEGGTEGGLTENKIVKEEGVEKETTPSFLWIEYFRDAVETYYQKPHDIFSIWFRGCQREGEFNNSFHALLTLLVHSRFAQGSQSTNALENTQRVFKLIVQPDLLHDEIPFLEGIAFFTGEVWRDLFHRALPKLQQIGNVILEKNKWTASNLEKLIQVIPHMGTPNSRMAVRWMNELIPDVVEVDFSEAPITIDESLYRVASRLGIVDPHFDCYQGRNSMGEIKIQSFAKAAFPENPLRVEEPMACMGRREENGGHCFPVHPRCEECLFETFCPRLSIDFNPSEKGMKE